MLKTPILLILAIIITLSCSNSNVSGGGAEAGNGFISGTVSIVNDGYKKDCEISLYPLGYSPFTNDTGKLYTKTDSYGFFSFSKLSEGIYNIFLQSADSSASLLKQVELVNNNDTSIQSYNLQYSSTLNITLSSEYKNSWCFIEGTDLLRPVIADSNNTLKIEKIPSDSIVINFYPESLNTIINIPEKLYINPGDTLHIEEEYRWIHINSENSPLPHDYIYSLHFSENAQYWGTYYGYLEIKDGDTLLVDVFNSSLQSAWIKKIYELSDGSLWFLNKTGATILSNQNWANIFPDSFGVIYQDVFDLHEIHSDTILLGVAGGILKVTNNDTIFDTTITPTGFSVFSIEANSQNELFFGTFGGGFYSLKGDIKDTIDINNSSLTSNNIQTLFVDSRDTLWVGSFGGGLYKYFEGNLIKIDGGFTDSIYSISETEDGSIWATTSEGDLIRYQSGEVSVINSANSPLPESALLTLSVDNLGRLFIGTYSNGLYILEEY